jgi:hypothetical protein
MDTRRAAAVVLLLACPACSEFPPAIARDVFRYTPPPAKDPTAATVRATLDATNQRLEQLEVRAARVPERSARSFNEVLDRLRDIRDRLEALLARASGEPAPDPETRDAILSEARRLGAKSERLSREGRILVEG